MRYTFTITRLVPWSDLNEYEGQIDGVIDGYQLCCYVLLPSGEAWRRYNPGDTLEVDLWLERGGHRDSIQIDPSAAPALQQLEGVNYQVSGRVTEIDDEMVILESILPLRVDLDTSSAVRHIIPTIREGDLLRVQGVLKIDLEP